jgi:hypothetical protein
MRDHGPWWSRSRLARDRSRGPSPSRPASPALGYQLDFAHSSSRELHCKGMPRGRVYLARLTPKTGLNKIPSDDLPMAGQTTVRRHNAIQNESADITESTHDTGSFGCAWVDLDRFEFKFGHWLPDSTAAPEVRLQ